MMDDFGTEFATYRDLAEVKATVNKIDEKQDKQAEKQGELFTALIERVARIETTLTWWRYIGPALLAAAVAFGPEVAQAFP